MIKTYAELKNEYSGYSNPKMKISRMVRSRAIFPICRGLYETDPKVDPMLLANAIYGPSYISFQTALSEYGIIPEVVQAITSATTQKRHIKEYVNEFGRYLYRDVPLRVFSYGIEERSVSEYSFFMARPEKAVCDMIYISSPTQNLNEFRALIFDDLRFDEYILKELNKDDLLFLSNLYNSTNHKLFQKFLKGEK